MRNHRDVSHQSYGLRPLQDLVLSEGDPFSHKVYPPISYRSHNLLYVPKLISNPISCATSSFWRKQGKVWLQSVLDQRQEWKAQYMGSRVDKLYQLNCTAVSDAPPSAASIENIDLWQSTLALKKNCSFVVQIVTWFASIGTSFSQSS